MTEPSEAKESKPKRKRNLFGSARRLKGLARVFVYLMFINAVGLVWTAASAKNAIGEKAVEFGRGLEQLSSRLKGANTININGQSMHILVSDSSVSVEQTLNTFERGCQRMNSGLVDLLKDVPKEKQAELQKELDGKPLTALGVLSKRRGEGDTLEGIVVCIAASDELRKTPITDRLVRFVETGDLAELGEFRYLYAKKPSSGNAASHVRVLWTEGSYDLFHMFAKDGRDAPGTDPSSAPRPKDSVRLIDAHATGQPHNIWLYDSRRSVEQTLADYDAEMATTAWSPDPFVSTQVEGARHFYNEHGSDLVVYASKSKNGRTAVTIVESNPAGGRQLPGNTPISRFLQEIR